MIDESTLSQVIKKYDRFFGEIYTTISDLEASIESRGGFENCVYVSEVWEEFGTTIAYCLVDIMCDAIVIIETPLTDEEKKIYF